MSILSSAGESLTRCERELRELGARALRDGDYGTARQLTELAEALADRRAMSGLNGTSGGVASGDSSAAGSPGSTSVGTSIGEGGDRTKSDRGSKLKRKGEGVAYPQFAKRGKKLIKVGWSKKNKQEYEHTTEWSAIFAFANHLRSHVRPGRVFTVEEVMPVPDEEAGYELPGYQVYLVLAWFRDLGLVEKRGREGYVVDQDKLTTESLQDRWAELLSREV